MRQQTTIIAFVLFGLSACSSPKQEPSIEPKAPEVTAAPKSAAPAKPDPRPVVVAFGDSLSAGFGVEPGFSYPDFLQKEIDQRGLKWRVVNLGVSGDTTTDGLNRVSEVLAVKPEIVIVEFGGNDGLRGLPLEITRSNLDSIVSQILNAGARVVLAGMTLPPNYGPEYIRPFETIYVDLAAKYNVPRIRFLLEGVGGNPKYMRPDGLHANAEGNAIVAKNVFRTLEPLLKKS
jgi:acyl-CoA thioesterase-1